MESPMQSQKVDLRNLDQNGLIQFGENLGQHSFRGKQIMAGMYRPCSK